MLGIGEVNVGISGVDRAIHFQLGPGRGRADSYVAVQHHLTDGAPGHIASYRYPVDGFAFVAGGNAADAERAGGHATVLGRVAIAVADDGGAVYFQFSSRHSRADADAAFE